MEIWLLYANLSKSFAWINQHKLIVIIMEFHEEETEHVYITRQILRGPVVFPQPVVHI